MMLLRTTTAAPAGLAAAVTFLLFSCGGSDSSTYGSGPGTVSTVVVVACPASGATDVSIVNASAGFNPNSASVPVNTAVRWTNNDSMTHTVTNTVVPTNGTFGVQAAPGASVCLKFTTAGTYNYYCSIHPTMTGAIVVQ